MKNTDQIIEEIHNEFYSAQTELLELHKIVKSDDEISKFERLSKLGFTAMVDHEKIRASNVMKAIAETIDKYKLTHEAYKLITNTQVDTICEKYNLVMGGVERYKGDIPEKNFLEIEKFVRPKDNKLSFKIVAPQKDMIIHRHEHVVNYRIVDKPKPIVPDPIVLLPVENDMFMVITAWGIESKDGILFNPKLN